MLTRIAEVIGVVTDISRLKFAQTIQRRHTETASAHAKALENFIDTTSHEVRDGDCINTRGRLRPEFYNSAQASLPVLRRA